MRTSGESLTSLTKCLRARNLIRSKAINRPVPDWNERDPRCLYEVSSDDVAAIAAGLEDARLQKESLTSLIYAGIEVPSYAWDGAVPFLVVVQNGDVVCYCG